MDAHVIAVEGGAKGDISSHDDSDWEMLESPLVSKKVPTKLKISKE